MEKLEKLKDIYLNTEDYLDYLKEINEEEYYYLYRIFNYYYASGKIPECDITSNSYNEFCFFLEITSNNEELESLCRVNIEDREFKETLLNCIENYFDTLEEEKEVKAPIEEDLWNGYEPYCEEEE